MRRDARSLALAALVFAGVWAVVAALGSPRTACFGGIKLAEKFARLEAFENAGPIEGFVVGASVVDQGFDAEVFTRETGLRSFDLGLSGTDMYLQSLLVRAWVLPRRPKAVLWSLGDELLTRSNINRQYLQSPALSALERPFGELRFALERRLPTAFRRRALDWLRELTGPREETVDAYGRTLLTADTREESRARRQDGADEGAPPRPSSRGDANAIDPEFARAHVAETLRLARAQGVDVWLLTTPYQPSLFERETGYARIILGEANVPYYEWLAELSTSLGMPLLDLHACPEISPRDEYFFDETHLNGAGAGPFARLVADLYLGRRSIPEEWRGFPSQAERDAFLTHVDPARIPVLPLGRKVPLERALRLRDADGVVTDVCAAFDVTEAGEYLVALIDSRPRARRGTFYLRLGGRPHYRIVGAPEGAHRVIRADAFALAPGRHVLELRTRAGQALDWDELLVAPSASDLVDEEER